MQDLQLIESGHGLCAACDLSVQTSASTMLWRQGLRKNPKKSKKGPFPSLSA